MAGRGIRISLEGLEELGADLGKLAHPGLRDAVRASLRGAGGEAIVSDMKSRVRTRTGRLVSGIGIHGDAIAGDDVLVGYQGGLSGGNNGGGRDQLGAWVESGVQPHEILPRDGGALKFNGGSFEKVHHPGQRGQKIAAKAMRATEWEVMADIVDKIDAMTGGAI